MLRESRSLSTVTTPLCCEGPVCRQSGVQNTQNFFNPIANVGINLVFQGEMRRCWFLLLRLILVRCGRLCVTVHLPGSQPVN